MKTRRSGEGKRNRWLGTEKKEPLIGSNGGLKSRKEGLVWLTSGANDDWVMVSTTLPLKLSGWETDLRRTKEGKKGSARGEIWFPATGRLNRTGKGEGKTWGRGFNPDLNGRKNNPENGIGKKLEITTI